MKAKNVGEWSELYALSTLLATSAGSGNKSKLPRAKRIRQRHVIADQAVEYAISNGIVQVGSGHHAGASITAKDISRLSQRLLLDVQEKSSRTFQSEAGAELAQVLQFLGASATIRDDLEVQWANAPSQQWVGISIKSLLGAKPTLLNASSATNFEFELIGQREVCEALLGTKRYGMKELFSTMQESGVCLKFVNMENDQFHENLLVFSAELPTTVATLLMVAAENQPKSLADVWDTACAQHDLVSSAAMPAMLEFLGAVGLGLRPSKAWGGRQVAFGGFIVVNADGTVEISDESRASALGEALFRKLRLEWGSRSKHNFGIPFVVGDRFFIKLNLQLRFI